MMRRFITWNVGMSKAFDGRFFPRFSVDGNSAFNGVAREIVAHGALVADVGGGKTPFFEPAEVLTKGLRVTGVDIDAAELAAAAQGAYASRIVCSLEKCTGPNNHDVVIAQSVLEHVNDGREAMRGVASLLRPGGRVVTFCPNRRAWFARLNLALPEQLKRAMLFSIFPEKRDRQGFPAHYDGCTPEEMARNMRAVGIDPVDIEYYYVSSYFMFVFPLYLFWRLATYPLMKLWPHRYCETFVIHGVRVTEGCGGS